MAVTMDEIGTLHENALVAWDRDGCMLSPLAPMLYRQGEDRCPRTVLGMKPLALVISGKWGALRDGDLSEFVLFTDSDDPLGCRWVRTK